MNPEEISRDYHDYVIKNGKLIGQFEEMYQNSLEVPWHQDKTAYSIMVDTDLRLLQHFHGLYHFKNVCDIGSGLGFVTNRISQIFKPEEHAKVFGFEVSSTAVKKAQEKFPHIAFRCINLLDEKNIFNEEKFDLIFIREVFWYIYPQRAVFFERLKHIVKPNGFVMISQSLPSQGDYLGKDVFPEAFSIKEFLDGYFDCKYCSSTLEFNNLKKLTTVPDRYLRYLGEKNE